MSGASEPVALAPAPLDLIPADAPFSEAQRAWLNGFFSAILTRPAAASQTPAAPSVVLSVLYASQTGTAESLARKFAKAARAKGFGANVEDAGSVGLSGLASRPLCLWIASTYGEGDPPDAAQAFAAELDSASGPALAGMRYAVLALGDRNYPKFCHFGITLDRRLSELGAERLIEHVEADLEIAPTFERWRESLWPVLPSPGTGTLSAEPPEEEPHGGWDREHPFAARLVGTRRLTLADSDKDTRHVTLSLKDSGLTYEPGDALGVWPRNGSQLIDRLLAVTGLKGDTTVVIDGSALGLREALAARCEIGRLTTAQAIRFAERFGDAELKALCEPEQVDALQRYLDGRDATDLFARPACATLDAHTLVELLPRLAPRLYSISSSLAAHPEEVHLTVGVVRATAAGQARDGIASTHLADTVMEGATVPIYVHHNARFRLPADAAVPVIMIGPGTGIAPFRAFLEERAARGLTGRTWLFFGERRGLCDFLYEDELRDWLARGTLTRLDTAFSRDGTKKVYVQDRMRAQAAEIWAWIVDGAHIYVCGDAQRMAKDVDRAIVELFMSEGKMSEATAQLEVRHLGANGRYLRDVY
jgi:sulfite reductase (NADPH) flavoprotein alpha-component